MSQPLRRFVDAGSTLDNLREHAQRLIGLQQHVDAALPAALAAACHVANMRDGTLLIHADNGAVAAKLRQATPRLAEALGAQGVPLAGIKIAIRPIHAAPPERPPTRRAVSSHAQQDMQSLANRLPPDDPLRMALERFVTRSRFTP